MSDKTIFKKIIDGEIPADVVHDDEHCLAFKDINPQAPVHVLVIPKKEITSIQTLTDDDLPTMGHICGVIRDLAAQLGLQAGVPCRDQLWFGRWPRRSTPSFPSSGWTQDELAAGVVARRPIGSAGAARSRDASRD